MEIAQLPNVAVKSTTAPSMPNVITLTFNGVDFNLVPSNNDTSAAISLSVDSSGEFKTINLQSFTGSLIVCKNTKQSFSSSTAMTTGVSTNSMNCEKAANTVEDEPVSPGHASDPLKDIPRGQQQLSFGSKKGTKNKKRGVNGDSQKRKRLSQEAEVPSLGQSSQSLSQQQTNAVDFDVDTLLKAPMIASPLARSTKIEELVRREEMKPTQSEESTEVLQEDGNDQEIQQENSPNAIKEIDEDGMDIDEANPYAAKDESPSCVSVVDKNAPTPRWGQTMTLIDDSKVLVYGGQLYDPAENKLTTMTDLYVYDLKKKTWSKPVNCEGMPRTWHSATFLPDRQLLISFGGESFNPKTKKTVTTDQVMVLDTEIMLWYPPSVSGNVPSGRSGHTATLLPNTNELVVFGGVKNNKWQNTMAVLDSMRWSWSVPKITGTAPKPRSYHSATAVPSSDGDGYMLVVFGGNNETECFNTVHVLDATKENWSWIHPNVSGTPPLPRTGHNATLLEDGKTIFIHGGWDPNDDQANDEDMMFGDSFLLDTSTWTWKAGPKPKFVPGAGENGGLKRVGASSVLAPGDDMSHVLIFGGRIPGDKFASDFQSATVPQRLMGM
jgi:N-acetylneuraminic acid mutarotase